MNTSIANDLKENVNKYTIEEIENIYAKYSKKDLFDVFLEAIKMLNKSSAQVDKFKKDKFGSTSEKIRQPENTRETKTINKPGRKQDSHSLSTKIINKYLNNEMLEGKIDGVETEIIKLDEEDILNNIKELGKEYTLKVICKRCVYKYIIYEKTKKIVTIDDGSTTILVNSINDPLEKKMLDVSSISHIIEQKYQYGVPPYRLKEEFLQSGINIEYNVINKTLMDVGKKLKGLADEIEKYAFIDFNSIIYVDETTHKLTNNGIKDDGTPRISNYIYALVTNKLVRYKFTGSRSALWLKKQIEDFKYEGYIVSDDFSGYNSLNNDKHQMCLSHARRKYYNAYCATSLEIRDSDGCISRKGLYLLDKIFLLERQLKDLSDEQKMIQRNTSEYQDAIDSYKEFIDNQNPIKDSLIYQAINYSKSNWNQLWIYRKNGELKSTNQSAELAIKKIAMIRKNSMIFDNINTGIINCDLLTVVQSAIINNLNVFDYLNYVITNIDILDISKLLPWHKDLYKFN